MHHSGGVTSTMYCCCFKKRKRDPTKKRTRQSPVPRLGVRPWPRFRETLVTSDLSSARTSATGRQPHDIRVSNRYPRPRTHTRRPFNLCHEGRYEVVQQVVVWFECFYSDTQGYCCSLYTVYIQKPSVLWRSPLLLSVALALVFMPGLYSTAYRSTFPAFLYGCL